MSDRPKIYTNVLKVVEDNTQPTIDNLDEEENKLIEKLLEVHREKNRLELLEKIRKATE